MFEVKSDGDFKKTRRFFDRLLRGDLFSDLDHYGQLGVDALSQATPVDTGLAQESWNYRIVRNRKSPRIEWYNTDKENGVLIVILIQYGHGTRNGGYVQGRDFINPAMRPVFDRIADDVWKKVKSL